MRKERFEYIITAVGIVLLAFGVYLVKTLEQPQAFMLAFPYVCIGIGCGVFGHGMGMVMTRRAVKNAPEIQRRIEIDRNDERNIAIANRAKAKAYELMTFMLGALMIAFALMGVEMTAVLLLVFVYLLIEGAAVYYRCKYDKEM